MPPSAFQNRNVGHAIRLTPASHADVIRSPVSQRPRNTAFGPWRGEKTTPTARTPPPRPPPPPDPPTPLARPAPRAREQPPSHPAPDEEADVVADDRRGRRYRDDDLDAEGAARGEDARGEQRGLAGEGDAHRLDRDEQEQHRIADVTRDGHKACQHHCPSSMPPVPALTAALTIPARDPASGARAGVLRTAHGEIRTPHFVPLATKATVKGLLPAEVAALGYDIVLGNTYHLFLDPGHELIAGLGGLHEFMGWHGPIVTDSGGFQVFSMGHGTVADEIKGRAPSGAD